jgi:hypothetical protein
VVCGEFTSAGFLLGLLIRRPTGLDPPSVRRIHSQYVQTARWDWYRKILPGVGTSNGEGHHVWYLTPAQIAGIMKASLDKAVGQTFNAS